MAHPSGPGREMLIARLRELAAMELRAIAGAPFALVDFPDYANVGDSAIWLGTLAFFRQWAHTAPAYVAAAQAFSERDLRAAVPDGPILIQGGGNFGDLWPAHQEFREHLLERFSDREIVQLPQSIHFTDAARADITARAIARHGRFRLLVRDRPSYEYARSRFDCEVRLCPDMALFLQGLRPERAPDVDVLYLMRTDQERRPELAAEWTGQAGPSARVVDWVGESRRSIRVRSLAAAARSVGSGWPARPRLRAARYQALAQARLARGCRLLSEGRVVITDRLHGHVLSLLLGIPHAVLDNSYGKLRGFLELWTGERASVRQFSSIAEAEQWAASVTAPSGLAGSADW